MKKPFLAPLFAATCSLLSSLFPSPATAETETQKWRLITSGTQSNIEEATQQIIQTPEQWRKWWMDHTNTRDQPDSQEAQLPKVDFNKETILIATLGMRSTGGHTVQFSEIRHEGDTLKAVITSSSPAPDAMVTMALTYPFAVIAIPKHEGPIEFVATAK